MILLCQLIICFLNICLTGRFRHAQHIVQVSIRLLLAKGVHASSEGFCTTGEKFVPHIFLLNYLGLLIVCDFWKVLDYYYGDIKGGLFIYYTFD